MAAAGKWKMYDDAKKNIANGLIDMAADTFRDALLEHARAKGWLTGEPLPGDVFLLMKSPIDAVHTGVVTAVAPRSVDTIEGNTNAGGSRDGWGVLARSRKRAGLLFIRLPDTAITTGSV